MTSSTLDFPAAVAIAVPLLSVVALILWDTRNRDIDQNHRYERSLANWTKVLGISTCFLFIATAYSAFVLNKTDDAIHRQLDAIERSSEPFIGISDSVEQPQFTPNSPLGDVMTWSFTYKNSGKGIADNFKIRYYIRLGANNQFKLSSPSGYFGTSRIAVDRSAFFTIPIQMDETTFSTLMKQDFGISALIEFTYTDSYNRLHREVTCVGHLANNAISILDSEFCSAQK